jgi:peptide/nickel transport system substrate-binding protein
MDDANLLFSTSQPRAKAISDHVCSPRRLSALIVLSVVVGCATPAHAPGRTDGPSSTQPERGQTPQKALIMAISREPESLEPALHPQNREWSALGSAFLAYFSPQQQGPVPYLAEELPTVDKGTWKLLPDGRMETTYKLKKNLAWHDGQPITAHDWVFGFTARSDPDFPGHSVNVERRLARAVAQDDHTLFLEWREAFMWAGMTHLPDFPPLARHKLEPLYLQDRSSFFDGPHWREEFIGSGPFRVVSWDPGVDIAFRAHQGFVLGKPGVDEIRVRFIGDANTIVANLLSGGIDVSFSVNIGFPQGQAMEQAGWNGKVEYWPGLPRYLEYQGRNWGNTQQAVFDPRVRWASHHAIDRQSIVETLFAGRAVVAYYWLPNFDPGYPAVDRVVPKFEYDPARAEAMLRDAGWAKGADGRARNAAGEPLSIPMMNHPAETSQLDAAVVVDNWKAVGITSDIHRLSQHEIRDDELRSKFPGVAYSIRNLSLDNMVWIGRNVSRPEARWSGQNRTGYVNPKLDDLWSKVLGSIDAKEREGWLIEAIRVMMDDAMVVLTHVTPDLMAYNPTLVGPAQPAVVDTSRIWNVWEWRWKQS